MINHKTARAAITGGVLSAAVAAAVFSAGSAAAKPDDIIVPDLGPAAAALRATPVTDKPGGQWISYLKTGQHVFTTDECYTAKFCHVWSANLGTPDGTGWVISADLWKD